ncbi:hypothetical protein OG568_42895 [Streptomyces sp. NBC_01450]|nr:hypothetical protein [Streptomyces sp. NBC_01450]
MVAAVIAVAVREGWDAEQVVKLTAIMLIFIALITSAGEGGN